MARKTIGTLHTAITADAQQYTNEFKRAQRATASFSAAINNTLSSLGVGLSFAGVAMFAKSVVNLGSQINDLSIVANMGTTQFQAIALTALQSGLEFEQTAKAAENLRSKIQDAAKGNTAAVESFKALNLSAAGLQALAPERQWEVVATAIANASDKQAAMNAASDIFGAKIAPKLRETLQLLASDGYDAVAASTKAFQLTPEQIANMDRIGDWWTKIVHQAKVDGAAILSFLGKEIEGEAEKLRLRRLANDWAQDPAGMVARAMALDAETQSLRDAKAAQDGKNQADMTAGKRAAQFDTDLASRAISLKQAAKTESFLQSTLQKAIALTTTATTKLTEEQVALGDKMEEAALSPLARYTKEIERLNGLEAAGIITTNAAAHAMGVAGEAYVKAEGDVEDYASRLTAAADDTTKFSKSGDEFSREMEQMWGRVADNASEAMAEILLNGQNTFEELGRVIIKTMLTAAIKAQLILPLMNFIGGTGGISPGIFGKFDGMKAGGGPVAAGKSYLVGEEGVEMFSPSTSGTITPNRTLANASGGGGDNFVFNYSFTSGITKTELLPFLTLTQRTTLAKIADVRRRGGSNAVAFA